VEYSRLYNPDLLPTLAPACKLAAAAFKHMPATLDAVAVPAAAAAAPGPASTGKNRSGGSSSSSGRSSSSSSWQPPSSSAELASRVMSVSSLLGSQLAPTLNALGALNHSARCGASYRASTSGTAFGHALLCCFGCRLGHLPEQCSTC
jgi:hypothetical protein